MNEALSVQRWSDPTVLQKLANPAPQLHYTVTIENPEVTFLGAKGQPDFAVVTIEYAPRKDVVELRSLKKYLHQFRNTLISYERFVSVVFSDLLRVYEPRRLKVVTVFRPRGGMTSTLVIDSASQQPKGENS